MAIPRPPVVTRARVPTSSTTRGGDAKLSRTPLEPTTRSAPGDLPAPEPDRVADDRRPAGQPGRLNPTGLLRVRILGASTEPEGLHVRAVELAAVAAIAAG